MQRTTQKKRVKYRKSPIREDNSQNPFEAALAAVCDELEQSGRFTAPLSDWLYCLFRIRAQKTGWRGSGCRHVMLEEVVQECMLNFWKGMCRAGKMRSHLLTLTGTNLRAYVAATVRLLILRQKWDLQKKEERQRGYCSPPAIMTRELDEETGRNWWDNHPAAGANGHSPPVVSPLDLEKLMAGQAGGFEFKVIEAAAEFFAASGHKEFADHLLTAAKAAGQRKKKSRRTTQRHKLENKLRLRKALRE